jgi:hypothetical protein
MEDIYLTYYKLLDGLDSIARLGMTGTVDLSFNDFITARYLVDNMGYEDVTSITDLKMINYQYIKPLRLDRNLSFTLRKLRADLIISLGGTFRFQPIHDVAYSLHGCLNIGGRIIMAVYPNLYDKQGRDMLSAFSSGSGVPVHDKLGRWYSTLYNTMCNLFVNVKTDDVITDASADEVMSLFSTDCFYRYLFRESSEYDRFFTMLKDDREYVLSWKVINALKV